MLLHAVFVEGFLGQQAGEQVLQGLIHGVGRAVQKLGQEGIELGDGAVGPNG